MEDEDEPENEFPEDHPFKDHFYAKPEFLSNMQDKLMAQVPTWKRVTFDGLTKGELVAMFEKMRASFPEENEEEKVVLPICWDWSDPASAFVSPLYDDVIIEANRKQKHEREESFIYPLP